MSKTMEVSSANALYSVAFSSYDFEANFVLIQSTKLASKS